MGVKRQFCGIGLSLVRGIDAQWYRMDIFDYGRHGEPVKLIKIPER